MRIKDHVYAVILDKGIKDTGDFAIERLPDVASQYLTYSIIWHSFCVVVIIILLAVMFILCKRFLLNSDNSEEYKVFVYAIQLIVSGVLLIILFGNMKSLLLATLVPKVFLLTSLADLLK